MSTPRLSRWKSLGVPAALLVLAFFYGWGAVSVTAQFDEGLVGPRFLPLLLTVIVVIGLLRIMYKEWWSRSVLTAATEQVEGSVPDSKPDSEPDPDPETISSGHGKPALVILAIVAYIGTFRLLGYPLATVILAFALLTLFGYGFTQPVRRLAVAGCITAVFYLLFMVCFNVRLPLLPGVGV